MNWEISTLGFAMLLSACYQENTVCEVTTNGSVLLEADQLFAMSGRPHIRIVDFRENEYYEEEHIEGAVNIWRTDIEDTSYAYGGMMASPAQIEKLFSRLGINSEDTLVIYDDNALLNASRLWWIMQNYDQKNVMMLQGGTAAWKAAHGKVSPGTTAVTATKYELPTNPSMRYVVSKEQVQAALMDHVTILDTRTTDEFSGARHKAGSAKGGRISGSMHIDWAEAVNYEGDKRIRPVEELERIYGRLNIAKDEPLIVYCHSGVRAAHTTFVLTQLLGYTNVKNYDGSWTEWSNDSDLPFEVDGPTRIEQ